jgi:hypothetical protein
MRPTSLNAHKVCLGLQKFARKIRYDCFAIEPAGHWKGKRKAKGVGDE